VDGLFVYYFLYII